MKDIVPLKCHYISLPFLISNRVQTLSWPDIDGRICLFLLLVVSLAILLDVQSRTIGIALCLYRSTSGCGNLWNKIQCYINSTIISENEYWVSLKEWGSLHRFWGAFCSSCEISYSLSQMLALHMEQQKWQSWKYLWHDVNINSWFRSKFCSVAMSIKNLNKQCPHIFTFLCQTRL